MDNNDYSKLDNSREDDSDEGVHNDREDNEEEEEEIGLDWNNNNISSSSSSQFNQGNQSDHQQDDFLDMLARSQEQRMNDQRCSIDRMNLLGTDYPAVTSTTTSSVSLNTGNVNCQDEPMQRSNSQPVEPETTGTSNESTTFDAINNINNIPTSSTLSSLGGPSTSNARSYRLLNSQQRSATIDRSTPTTNGINGNSDIDRHRLNMTNGRRGSNPIAYSSNRPTSSSGSASLSSAYGSSGSDLGNARDELLDMIAALQSRRLDEQRAPLSVLRRSLTTTVTNGSNCHSELGNNNLNPRDHGPASSPSTHQVRENAFDEETNAVDDLSSSSSPGLPDGRKTRQMSLGANILPDDAFFEHLMRFQSSRLEDQRVTLPNLFAPYPSSSSSSSLSTSISAASKSDPISSSNNIRCSSPSPSTATRTDNQPGPSTSSSRINVRLNPSSSESSATTTSPSNRAAFARNRSATIAVESIPMNQCEPNRGANNSDPMSEDFFGLLMRFQSARIEDQRSPLPTTNQPTDDNGDDSLTNIPGGTKSPDNSSTSNSSLTSTSEGRKRINSQVQND